MKNELYFDKKISRRVFLENGLLTLGAAALFSAKLAHKDSQNSKEDRSQNLAEILQYDVLPSLHKTPVRKGGIGYNAVFAPYRNDEVQDRTLDFAVKNGATFLRIIFDCPEADYEPKIGIYKKEILDRFSQFCIKAIERDLSLIVVFSDGYRMGACLKPNIFYGSRDVTGPYYQPDKNDDPWMPFYTDLPLTLEFEKRTKKIADAVTKSLGPHLTPDRQLFFEVMNEPGIPKGKEGGKIMNRWLLTMHNMLKSEYGISSIAGVADPNMVHVPSIKTLHYYPFIFFNSQAQLSNLVNQPPNSPPVFIEEAGVSDLHSSSFSSHDQRLFGLLSDIFFQTTKIDPVRKTIQLLTSPLMCLWHIDAPNKDSYQITDKDLASLQLIRQLSVIYQKAAV